MKTGSDNRLSNASAFLNRKVFFRRPSKSDAGRIKGIGKIRHVVFHPKKAKIVGYLVKRPDLAWMFRRGDVFVSVNGLEEMEGLLVCREGNGSYGHDAEKALASEHGIGLDDCIPWLGLPVLSESGKAIGSIRDISFNPETGNIRTLEVSKGAAADTVLGTIRIEARDIRGFKRGRGALLSDGRRSEPNGREPSESSDGAEDLGAIVVSDDVLLFDTEGGIASKAGKATAIVADRSKKAYGEISKKTEGLRKKTKEQAGKAAATAGEAVEKGAFVTGRQIARAGGMFSEFKDEFLKAMDGNDDDE